MSVGAFFDIDGTLVPPPSLERRLLRWLRWRREVRPANFARWIGTAARRLPRGVNHAFGANKSYLAGLRWAVVERGLSVQGRHPAGIYPGALGRLLWHAHQGHRVFLVSGTLAPLARALAEQFPVPTEVCATEIEIVRDRLTGNITGPHGHVSGLAKAAAVAELARRHRLHLKDCYAYGNSSADRWLLQAVGHPVAVNPTWRLARLARRHGWRMVRWTTGRRFAPAVSRHGKAGKCLPAT